MEVVALNVMDFNNQEHIDIFMSDANIRSDYLRGFDVRATQVFNDRHAMFERHQKHVTAQQVEIQLGTAILQGNALSLEQQQRLQSFINANVQKIIELRQTWTAKMETLFYELRCLCTLVVNRLLANWKSRQQQSKERSASSEELDEIEKCCEHLAKVAYEVYWYTNDVLMVLMVQLPLEDNCQERLRILLQAILQLVGDLVTKTFVIVKQPQQIVATNANIHIVIKLLVGKVLKAQLTQKAINFSIINEVQSAALDRNEVMPVEKIGIIENTSKEEDKENAVLNGQDGHDVCFSFEKLKLRNFKRKAPKGCNLVSGKFALLLRTEQFAIAIPDLTFNLCKYSLPIVVMVNGSQEEVVWPQIIWLQSLADLGVPQDKTNELEIDLPWKTLGEELSAKFESYILPKRSKSTTVAGRRLTQNALKFLASKLFPNYPPGTVDYDDMMLSYSRFANDALAPPRVSTSFWKWIYGILKLTHKHLAEHYVKGHIVGFMSREDCKTRLMQCPGGSFLFRFSETVLGSVTIAWVVEHNGQKEVSMLEPYTMKRLDCTSLDELTMDPQMKYLRFLYIETETGFELVPKETVFATELRPRVVADGYKAQEIFVAGLTDLEVPPQGAYGQQISNATDGPDGQHMWDNLGSPLYQSPNFDAQSAIDEFMASIATDVDMILGSFGLADVELPSNEMPLQEELGDFEFVNHGNTE